MVRVLLVLGSVLHAFLKRIRVDRSGTKDFAERIYGNPRARKELTFGANVSRGKSKIYEANPLFQ
jgi:hypothetical protein